MNEILAGYAAAAGPDLVARFEAISSADMYAPVLDLLPKSPVRMMDVGAGTGRDAAWFARQGHHVIAVEPVEELRAAGMLLHDSTRIEWLDDQLPELATARATGAFDFVTLCAVWQHIDDPGRRIAIKNLGHATNAGGLLIMSLRDGPAAQDRQVFPASVEETIYIASLRGFELVRRAEAVSVQAGNRVNGVRWTWLGLRKIC